MSFVLKVINMSPGWAEGWRVRGLEGQVGWPRRGGLAVPATPHSLCRPQYRLAPIPRARHYFACASLVFLCILLVHVLLMPRSDGGGQDGQAAGVSLGVGLLRVL